VACRAAFLAARHGFDGRLISTDGAGAEVHAGHDGGAARTSRRGDPADRSVLPVVVGQVVPAGGMAVVEPVARAVVAMWVCSSQRR
jgi:hypothetical protein